MEEPWFSLHSERDGHTLCLTLAGDFERGQIARVERELEVIRDEALKHVVFDLRALTFLDVAGLRTILNTHKRAQSEAFGVTVIRPLGLANRVFTLTRAGEILSMTDA